MREYDGYVGENDVKVWELKITKAILVTTTIQKTIQTIEVFFVKCVSKYMMRFGGGGAGMVR
jgi:hypothetical protein